MLVCYCKITFLIIQCGLLFACKIDPALARPVPTALFSPSLMHNAYEEEYYN